MDGTLPQDHEDQLQLGIRIITSAYQNKQQSMEQEIRGLRLTTEEQRANMSALQKKNSALEVELVESHQRAQQLAEENKELFKTVGSLRKQIGRLEHLKSAVLSSIQDDAEKEADIGDTRALMNEEYLRSATPLTAGALGFGGQQQQQFGGQQQQQQFGGQANYQGNYGQAPISPKQPANFGGGGGGGFDPMAGQGGMPGNNAPGPIDGKAFFRQARGVLSHEAFNQFLQSIKKLNNQQQTREETLGEAQRLFGPEHQALYSDFESLLNRQGL